MSQSIDLSSGLSSNDAEDLQRAAQLAKELQAPAHEADGKLTELKDLVDRCRESIYSHKGGGHQVRREAIRKARNYLHYLRNMEQEDARSRLKGVARRLQVAIRGA